MFHSFNTDYFIILQQQLAQHQDLGDIFICGDLNARTEKLQDIEQNIVGHDRGLEDLVSSIADSARDIDIGFKFSQDMSVNNYGRILLELCKATGFRIMNGRLHSDKNMGEFTYESDMGKSVTM